MSDVIKNVNDLDKHFHKIYTNLHTINELTIEKLQEKFEDSTEDMDTTDVPVSTRKTMDTTPDRPIRFTQTSPQKKEDLLSLDQMSQCQSH